MNYTSPSRNNESERRNYSKLTAQIARSTVKKKILDIRSRGTDAANELIDEFVKKESRSTKQTQFSVIEDKIVPIIEQNRSKWRNFVIECSKSFDPERLATLGVNLIYGGLLTASANNAGWASIVDINKKGREESLSRLLSLGKSQGNFVWILRGEEAFSPEIARICRSFADFAFMLVCDRQISTESLSGLKNALILIKSGNKKSENEVLRAKIPYILVGEADRLFDRSQEGRGSSYNSGALRPLTDFLESPRCPIPVESLSDVLDSIENLLSAGNNSQIPHYFA